MPREPASPTGAPRARALRRIVEVARCTTVVASICVVNREAPISLPCRGRQRRRRTAGPRHRRRPSYRKVSSAALRKLPANYPTVIRRRVRKRERRAMIQEHELIPTRLQIEVLRAPANRRARRHEPIRKCIATSTASVLHYIWREQVDRIRGNARIRYSYNAKDFATARRIRRTRVCAVAIDARANLNEITCNRLIVEYAARSAVLLDYRIAGGSAILNASPDCTRRIARGRDNRGNRRARGFDFDELIYRCSSAIVVRHANRRAWKIARVACTERWARR